MALRLGMPVMGVGSLATFWSKQSERLWAGSVEMMSTCLIPVILSCRSVPAAWRDCCWWWSCPLRPSHPRRSI